MKKFGKKNRLSFNDLNANRLAGRILTIAALVVLMSACVTINIYFPAAAAEKAADKIIDDVWQLKPGELKPGELKPGEAAPVAPSAAPVQ